MPPGQPPWSTLYGASNLLLTSDLGLLLVAACSVSWLAAGWIQARVASPLASSVGCLAVGSRLLLGSPAPVSGRLRRRGGRRLDGRPRSSGARRAEASPGWRLPAGLASASGVVGMVVSAPAAVAAAAALFLSGHVPDGAFRGALVGGLVLATGGAVAAATAIGRDPSRRGWLAARGPHLLAASLVGEALLLSACVAVASSITHTEGTLVSVLDVALAAVVARAVVASGLPAAGAVVADVVFLAMLVSVGISPSAAVAIVATWRVGMVLAWWLGLVASKHRRADVLALSHTPTGSGLGERFHRWVFRSIGRLPRAVAARVRGRIFETIFSLSDDPWRYDVLPYEVSKREHLLREVPREPGTTGSIVELGCADGHNLDALARSLPDRTIVGLDISGTAVAAATGRTRSHDNVTVLHADARGTGSALTGVGVDRIGVLILAEVLYYVGNPAQVRAELEALASLLAVDATVVLLHQRSDAKRLHRAAAEALGCRLVRTVEVDDRDRPYVIDLASPTSRCRT